LQIQKTKTVVDVLEGLMMGEVTVEIPNNCENCQFLRYAYWDAVHFCRLYGKDLLNKRSGYHLEKCQECKDQAKIKISIKYEGEQNGNTDN
jgi:hypothetical protein